MKAKDYLRQIKKINSQIINKSAEVEFWRSVATGCTIAAEGEKVQSSGSKDKVANAICNYIEMEQEINAAIKRLVKARQDIIGTIEQLPVAQYDVLHKIYVQDKTFYETATDLHKSYSWVTTVHGKALVSVQKIINSENATNCIKL